MSDRVLPRAHAFVAKVGCAHPMDDGGSCDASLGEHYPKYAAGPAPKWPCAACGRPVVPTVRGLAPRHYRAGLRVTCGGSGALVRMTPEPSR